MCDFCFFAHGRLSSRGRLHRRGVSCAILNWRGARTLNLKPSDVPGRLEGRAMLSLRVMHQTMLSELHVDCSLPGIAIEARNLGPLEMDELNVPDGRP